MSLSHFLSIKSLGASLLLVVGGQVLALEPVSLHSHSGQFLVRGLPLGAPLLTPSSNAVSYVRLDPAVEPAHIVLVAKRT